mmetsp:Transcript_13115/g.36229  ORF Transcript_13115/g.36229 Transcript_13115/m.36229 type:complete len:111 (-) Transcript_13115:781-1113(-)
MANPVLVVGVCIVMRPSRAQSWWIVLQVNCSSNLNGEVAHIATSLPCEKGSKAKQIHFRRRASLSSRNPSVCHALAPSSEFLLPAMPPCTLPSMPLPHLVCVGRTGKGAD